MRPQPITAQEGGIWLHFYPAGHRVLGLFFLSQCLNEDTLGIVAHALLFCCILLNVLLDYLTFCFITATKKRLTRTHRSPQPAQVWILTLLRWKQKDPEEVRYSHFWAATGDSRFTLQSLIQFKSKRRILTSFSWECKVLNLILLLS